MKLRNTPALLSPTLLLLVSIPLHLALVSMCLVAFLLVYPYYSLPIYLSASLLPILFSSLSLPASLRMSFSSCHPFFFAMTCNTIPMLHKNWHCQPSPAPSMTFLPARRLHENCRHQTSTHFFSSLTVLRQQVFAFDARGGPFSSSPLAPGGNEHNVAQSKAVIGVGIGGGAGMGVLRYPVQPVGRALSAHDSNNNSGKR